MASNFFSHQRIQKIVENITIPAHQVTSVAFGGPNLDEIVSRLCHFRDPTFKFSGVFATVAKMEYLKINCEIIENARNDLRVLYLADVGR